MDHLENTYDELDANIARVTGAVSVGELSKADVLHDPQVKDDYEEYYAALLSEASPLKTASLIMLADRLSYYYAVIKHAERRGWSPIGHGAVSIEHPVSHYRMITDTFKQLVQQWNLALERAQKPNEWRQEYEEQIAIILGEVLSSSPESLRAIVSRIKELEISA